MSLLLLLVLPTLFTLNQTAYCVANLVHIKPDCRKSVLSMCSMNVCSPRERLTPITDHVFDHECDIVGLTETWLTESVKDLPLIQLLTPPGYKFLHVTRSTGGTGGGVALLYKSTMKVTVVTPPQKHRSFEALETRCIIPGRQHSSCRDLLTTSLPKKSAYGRNVLRGVQ